MAANRLPLHKHYDQPAKQAQSPAFRSPADIQQGHHSCKISRLIFQGEVYHIIGSTYPLLIPDLHDLVQPHVPLGDCNRIPCA